MSRRRPAPELTNSHERWLVSYADFLTLLFAFFVVMYSTSAVNDGDFRVLSDSIVRSFGLNGTSFAPDNIGDGGTSLPMSAPLAAAGNEYAAARELAAEEVQRSAEQVRQVQEALSDTLGEVVPPGSVAVPPDADYIDIEIPAGLLFPSGARTLLSGSIPIIARIADALRGFPNEIVVQGHTDDQLIQNGQFPSNWELSTARAAAVVRVFESQGIDPARMSAQGYAATRPVAGNDTQEGRELNRRVVVRVRSQLAAKP